VERRRRSPARKSRIAQPSIDNNSTMKLSLPHIADFIEDGQITLGQMDPVGCVAIANDGHNSPAMLVRNDGETLAQLLVRLDQAIAKAIGEDTFTDEING
jgi:hypothetical protein